MWVLAFAFLGLSQVWFAAADDPAARIGTFGLGVLALLTTYAIGYWRGRYGP
jgi:hypothetical protein